MWRPGEQPADFWDADDRTGVSARATTGGQPAVRVWNPSPQVSFGRRDQNREGYREAARAAKTRGYAVSERSVGGHAVAFTGSTIAFRQATPTTPDSTGIGRRYETVSAAIASALESLGIAVETGEPSASFCPGAHSLSAEGKVAGFAQRIHRDVAVTAGLVVVSDHEEIGGVLDPVYAALDVPFDPGSVGSVARAGGPADPAAVSEQIETALAAVDSDS